jgi:hypothetical protein
MSGPTKKQKNRALELMRTLSASGVPDFITPAEAARLCDRYGCTTTRFHKWPEDLKHWSPVNLATLSMTIARKEQHA